MALAGVSTLGVTFGYGCEDSSSVGTKPTTFTQLTRINSIAGIEITPEQIDASALEDLVEKSVAGRASNGGSFTVAVNFTPETKTEWSTLISAYKALTGGAQMWFEVIIPSFTEAFFVVAQPPQEIPMPSLDQNGLLTVEFALTIVDYKGMDTKVAF